MKLRNIILTLLLSLLFSDSNAFHIVGGDFTAKYLGGTYNYQVTLKLFRDCSNAQGADFDDTIIVAVYRKNNNFLEKDFTMALVNVVPIQLAGPSCGTPQGVCMEVGTYITNINLPAQAGGYYLIWERCCRNTAVINLSNPQNSGMAFYLEIPNPSIINSTPVFKNPPIPYMCINQEFTYDFSAADVDGDSLYYKLVTPLDGGHTSPQNPNPFSTIGSQGLGLTPDPAPYQPVGWAQGYSVNQVMDANPQLKIDGFTGLISVTPTALGLYAMAIVCEEWRNGVRIGISRRELETFVITCNQNADPIAQPTIPPGANNVYTVKATDSLCFTINFSDIKDSITISFNGDCFAGGTAVAPFATSNADSGFLVVDIDFCWKTTCDHIANSPYKVEYKIKDNGCPLPKTKRFSFTINVVEPPSLLPANLLCMDVNNPNQLQVFYGIVNPQDSGFFKYFLLYKSAGGGPYNLIDTIFDVYKDNFIDLAATNHANINYCYYMLGVNKCDNIVYSDTLCSDDAKNINVNYISRATVNTDNSILLKWDFDQNAYFSTYKIEKGEHNEQMGIQYQPWKTLNQYAADSIVDTEVATATSSYCYRMLNIDYCKNISPYSNDACTILLQGNASPFENHINWSEYYEWKGGVEKYEIWRADDDDSPLAFLATVSSNTFNFLDNDLSPIRGYYKYRIKAIEGQGSRDEFSWSNEIILIQQPVLYVPNAFTPNDDGVNDKWELFANFLREFNVTVFNRWGQPIFQTKNPRIQWAGEFVDKSCPTGVYYYKIDYKGFINDDLLIKTGSVTILR
ncbi:MAG: gliding motility-associated C-terminal domain-containing protein [Bacteroidetes bacterium]|nr:gliding motility-associated C-terminal domain-containing protein [Bacteroidota bacterium]